MRRTLTVLMAVAFLGVTSTQYHKAGHYTVPSRIAHDCSRDVSTAISNWIGSLPDGNEANPTVASFATNGCYRTDRGLAFTGRHDVVVDGHGATFRRTVDATPNQAHWRWDDSTNIAMRNLHIVGMNTVSGAIGQPVFEPGRFGSGCDDGTTGQPATCFESGLAFTDDLGVTVADVTTDGTYGDGLTIGGEHDPTDLTTDITIGNVTVDRNGRQGIAIGTAHNITITNTQLLHSWATGFDLEVNGDDGTISDVDIGNSYINSRTVAFASTGVAPVTRAAIHDNMIQSSIPSWPWLIVAPQAGPGTDWQISHNTVVNDRDEIAGISIDNVNGVRIADNVSHEAPPPAARAGEPLVGVAFGSHVGGTVVITGNDFTGNTAVYGPPSSSVIACGNKLTTSFDQPHPCGQVG